LVGLHGVVYGGLDPREAASHQRDRLPAHDDIGVAEARWSRGPLPPGRLHHRPRDKMLLCGPKDPA